MLATTENVSPKSGLVAFVTCLIFGVLGIHRFYVGKIGTGLLMIITAGGLGFWVLYDLFSIVCHQFTDLQGRVVEVAPNPTAPRNLTLLFLCLYILLFGSVGLLIGQSVGKLSKVGKSELMALRQGNVDEAYSYTSAAFQKGVSLAEFKKFVAGYPPLHDNVDSTFNDVNYSGNTGAINGSLNMKDGSQVPVEMDMVNENNGWKVNEINLNSAAPAKVADDAPAPSKPVAPAPAEAVPASAAPAPAESTPAPAAAPTADQTPATAAPADTKTDTQPDAAKDQSNDKSDNEGSNDNQ